MLSTVVMSGPPFADVMQPCPVYIVYLKKINWLKMFFLSSTLIGADRVGRNEKFSDVYK